MPCWYYDKKELRETPSIKDGITYDTERRYRKEGARFIMTCGTQMGLGHNTMATGVVYFHRFYMQHSFKSFPRYVTACCCLFLAGKVEETPKKCRDIIKTARGLLADNHFYSFGEDPKEEVMTLERILLQTIKFDLQVEHPYSFLLKYAKCFKGDQQKLQRMVQMAWNFVNDSLSTVVCLQWEPEIIAVALIHLASKLSKFTVVDWIGRMPNHLRWWDMFVADVTMDILEDICHQVLDLYQNKKEPNETPSPPQKPPSRADSPTGVGRLPINSNNSSPVGKTTTKTATTPTTTVTSSSVSVSSTNMGNSSSIAVVGGEINNIQSIKSLAISGPAAVPPIIALPDTLAPATTALSTNPANNFHMYHAPPPPPHSLYGTGPPPGPSAAPPPPQPPIGPAYPPNAWPQGLPPPHYNNVPPIPTQGTGGSGVGPPPGTGYYPPTAGGNGAIPGGGGVSYGGGGSGGGGGGGRQQHPRY